ncbi:MAG: dihydrofolate reductase family protein [Candidatus Delongbacteria bacterium]
MELIYYVAASLDGYIATPDGGVDWLDEFNGGDDDYGYSEFLGSVDVLLMGSLTWRRALELGDWAWGDKPCVVFTRQELESDIPNLIVETRSPRVVVEELARAGHQRAWLVGGGRLAAALLQEDLLTDVIISSMPVLLGAGIPLVHALGEVRSLSLEDTRCYSNGVVQSHYRVD